MKDKRPVSVYIITLNAERTLAACLESVRDFSEVVVVDSGSTDRTVEIAKAYGAKVVYQEWLGFARQKQLALSMCQHDWVLNLDADEYVSDELKKEIDFVVQHGDVVGLNIPIREIFLGKPNHPWTKMNRHIRFFKRELGGYADVEVHESISVSGPVRDAKGVIFHDGLHSLSVMLEKNNRYSSLRAQEKFKKGKSASVLKLLLVFPVMFIKSYLIKRNFLNGVRGWIASLNNAFYAFMKEAKLYELKLNAKEDNHENFDDHQ